MKFSTGSLFSTLATLAFLVTKVRAEECTQLTLWNADDDVAMDDDDYFIAYGYNKICKQDWEFNLETKLGWCNDEEFDRIVFKVMLPNGRTVIHTERKSPYFAFGDDYNLVKGRRIQEGVYEVYLKIYYDKDVGYGNPYVENYTIEFIDC